MWQKVLLFKHVLLGEAFPVGCYLKSVQHILLRAAQSSQVYSLAGMRCSQYELASTPGAWKYCKVRQHTQKGWFLCGSTVQRGWFWPSPQAWWRCWSCHLLRLRHMVAHSATRITDLRSTVCTSPDQGPGWLASLVTSGEAQKWGLGTSRPSSSQATGRGTELTKDRTMTRVAMPVAATSSTSMRTCVLATCVARSTMSRCWPTRGERWVFATRSDEGWLNSRDVLYSPGHCPICRVSLDPWIKDPSPRLFITATEQVTF